MPIQSMTGFARVDAAISGGRAIWELKSVNGKSLDVRLRLPPGFDRIEGAARALAQGRFKRGSLSASLTLTDATAEAGLQFNAAALDAALALRAELAASSRVPLAPSTIEGLLSIRGVLGERRTDTGEDDARDAELMAAFGEALDALAAMRMAEGARVASVVEDQVDGIERLARQAAADPSLTVDAITERLTMQIALAARAAPDLDPQRLHAEAVLLSTRADIREEVDRLLIHTASIRALLKSPDAAGRKLDFLAQELNREANTLCSKANAASLTAIGLDLKVAIDQFREQIQNLE